MLTVIQIIAILQGLFLGYVLFKKKHEQHTPVYWLFIGSILSVVLFSLGDDDYNLIQSNTRWFFFHEPLMITFLFLLVRYINSGRKTFRNLDVLFSLPYLLYVTLEIISTLDNFQGNMMLASANTLVECSFLGLLCYSIYDIFKHQKENWLLLFIFPFTVIFALDQVTIVFSRLHGSIFVLDSYGIFLLAILLFLLCHLQINYRSS